MRILEESGPLPESCVVDHVALPEPRPPDRAFVRLNMIASADGGTAMAGVSGGLGNRDDHAVFAALRRAADGVLVGLGTVVAEAYRVPDPPHLQLYVVADVPDVSGAPGPLRVGARRRSCSPTMRAPRPRACPSCGAVGDGQVDLPAVLAARSRVGARRRRRTDARRGARGRGPGRRVLRDHRAACHRRRLGPGGARTRRRAVAVEPRRTGSSTTTGSSSSATGAADPSRALDALLDERALDRVLVRVGHELAVLDLHVPAAGGLRLLAEALLRSRRRAGSERPAASHVPRPLVAVMKPSRVRFFPAACRPLIEEVGGEVAGVHAEVGHALVAAVLLQVGLELLRGRVLQLDRCPVLREEHLGADRLRRRFVEQRLAVARGEHGQLELAGCSAPRSG